MSVAQLLLALIAIFVSARLFGAFAERAGQPAVLGELAGGILAGASGLRIVDPHDPTIHLLAELGVILLLFLIGLDTDLKKLLSVGPSAASVALIGVVLPFAGGFAFARSAGFPTLIAILLGASLTATSVGITARVLSDLGHLQDDESQVILGAAVVDDIIGLVLLTVVGTLAGGGSITASGLVRTVVVAFGFVILAIGVGSWLAPHLIRLVERVHRARGLFFASIIFAFALAYLAQRAGSALIIGSFAAGLVLARTEKGREIEVQVHNAAAFFIPIFFVSVGAAVNVRALDGRFLMIGAGLTAIGIVGKVAAGWGVVQRGLRRSVIGVGMIPRGEVGLIFAQIGLTTGLLGEGLYSAVALMVMTTTMVTPPLLRLLLTRREGGVAKAGGHDFATATPMDREDSSGVDAP